MKMKIEKKREGREYKVESEKRSVV